MKQNNILNLSLQQIRIFLKAYEYRNYSRVAEELNFTPSMISKTIRSLEEMLGFRLFIRSYHLLTPTPAAVSLAACWRGVYDQIQNGISQARDVQTHLASRIRIGLLESTPFCAQYILTKLEENASPELYSSIQWEKRDMHALPQALLDGQFDLIITWSGEKPFFQNQNCEWRTFFPSPDSAFIARGHPLFQREHLDFSELATYSFITLSPDSYPHYYDYLMHLCALHGFTPLITTTCGSTESARYNVDLGKGIYIAPGLICCDWESEDVRKFDLGYISNACLVIVWRANTLTPQMKEIVQIITH